MKLRLFRDETVNIDLPTIVSNLLLLMPNSFIAEGASEFRIKTDQIASPRTYKGLSKEIKNECKDDDLVILFSEKQYDNNYFFESPNGQFAIVSLFGWDYLTNLHRNNGAVYFIAAIIVRTLGIGSSHSDWNTGCINDFWTDKTGIDVGMRSAFICPSCTPKSTNADAEGVKAVLNELSAASRANDDVCALWKKKYNPLKFDVFLCHNSEDKEEVRSINNALKKSGINTWLDEEQLPPGRSWQKILEDQIETVSSAAILVGKSGYGPWQNEEMRAFLSEFVQRKCPVIPVILNVCETVPQLPIFLRQFTWVDYRKNSPDPHKQLVWGITGKKPI